MEIINPKYYKGWDRKDDRFEEVVGFVGHLGLNYEFLPNGFKVQGQSFFGSVKIQSRHEGTVYGIHLVIHELSHHLLGHICGWFSMSQQETAEMVASKYMNFLGIDSTQYTQNYLKCWGVYPSPRKELTEEVFHQLVSGHPRWPEE